MTRVTDASTFYPTPRALIRKMLSKVEGSCSSILEPSAGKGDIIEEMEKGSGGYGRHKYTNISAIEIDTDLRATLRGKGMKLLDQDFLSFSGPDKFDLIIANPPFDHGEKHLLKAIDIMYRGQIVFLLNAETIRNPHSNTRKLLARKLDELNAEIEYHELAFSHAERATAVEIALIYIVIKHDAGPDMFDGADDLAETDSPELEEKHEISTGKHVYELVSEYNQTVEEGTQTIVDYYKHYPKIWKYLMLNKTPKDYRAGHENVTTMMETDLNELLTALRKDYWRRTLDLREVKSRMTTEKMQEFEATIADRCRMDFTENNIRAFVLNLIGGYEEMLTDAVLKMFDRMSFQFSYDGRNPLEKNIHYFNGWKTNDAFKVGRKVIIPLHCGWGHTFVDDYSGKWKMDYTVPEQTRDIDIVMSYFDGMDTIKPLTIADALGYWLEKQESKNISSTYFSITVYKKGTMHLTFIDEDILRRFNVAACKGKGWLPQDYGVKPFKMLESEERAVAQSFEGEKSYTENLGRPVFAERKSDLQLTFSEDAS